jgi:hypothetical protein
MSELHDKLKARARILRRQYQMVDQDMIELFLAEGATLVICDTTRQIHEACVEMVDARERAGRPQ